MIMKVQKTFCTFERNRSGQVVTEYVMILTIVVAALAVTKLKINSSQGGVEYCDKDQNLLRAAENNLSACADSEYKTIMKSLSDSFTVWMQDLLIIISLPS